MNRIAKASFWTAVFVLILLISSGSISAQKVRNGGVLVTPFAEDTAINPHDFTNEYYEVNGIVGKLIVNRRTGSDGLSIFSKSSNPFHTDVRVIATIPAYDPNGGILFWYPLGEIQDYGFTDDKMGIETREMANRFPIYVFPHSKIADFQSFTHNRQAPLMDNTWSMIAGDMNPLGIRKIVLVRFTEKAFTKEGYEMMSYMAAKNGMSADDTPILRTLEDLNMMMKSELISTGALKGPWTYAIAPALLDPTTGVIARDAFLWFATKDGDPLPTEEMFLVQFRCLQKTGNWCKQ